MKNIQLENGYTSIANEVFDALLVQPLSGYELRVALFIIRKTWGWHKKEDKISLSQIANGIDIPHRNVCSSIKQLVSERLLAKTKGKVNTLQFNKHYEEWVVSKRHLPSVKKTTTPVSKRPLEVVSKRPHTKETIKETITKEISTNVLTGFGNPDINELSSYFLEVFQLPKEDCARGQSRQYWFHLLRESKTGVQGVKWLIDQAYQDEWYKNNITSSKDLYYKRIKIIARKRGDMPRVAVMPKEAQ